MHPIGSAPPPEEARPDAAALFGALAVAVLLVDPADRIALANGSAEQLLNRSERSMIGRPLAEAVRYSRERVAGEGDLTAYDVDVETPAGPLRLDLTESRLPGHPGWRVVTLHAGGSHRAPAGPDGARAASGAAAILAHEIKNPLSGIRGAAQLLGPGELTGLIVAEVDRIAALIDRMQGFTDTRPLAPAAENIHPLLVHARRVAQAGFACGVAIESRYDPSLPPARVDRDAFTQIVLNLLKNAAEALEGTPEPVITLATAYRHGLTRTDGEGGRVALPIELSVIDNGPGAPADLADQLFHPFVSGRRDGTGLGLALADKLARDMGGLVQYAREGGRTVFRVLLPRAA